jgi:predicted ATPase with chaperone activity
MLARAVTHALVGLEPRRVDVEVHIQTGIPAFAIVGLVDRAVRWRTRSTAKHALCALDFTKTG